MTTVSTHILDTQIGRPATGVQVILERETSGAWAEVGRSATDADGRVAELGTDLDSGVYRLRFLVGGFFPEIQVLADLDGAVPHYHLPILVSPFGFTAYRGS